MGVTFTPPKVTAASSIHHRAAAEENAAVGVAAAAELRAIMTGQSDNSILLLKAAAGAGKSFLLRELVASTLEIRPGSRVAVTAFTNAQVQRLAADLANDLGRESVCLFTKKDSRAEVPQAISEQVDVFESAIEIPQSTRVVVGTAHKLGAMGEYNRLLSHFGPATNGEKPFDVLFCDEAWQLRSQYFDRVRGLASIWVAVGDVGQLPPLEIGENPWRGDSRYNPIRAWPEEFAGKPGTWERELPTVWRPAAGHLALWRAFYPEWAELDCVAAPPDRWLNSGLLAGDALEVWNQVGSGVPTLLEVDGLPEPDAADVDLPLLRFGERLLDELLSAGATLEKVIYDDDGDPTPEVQTLSAGDHGGDPLMAILATRNQAVDDAADAVDRLTEKHGLEPNDIVVSTVDKYQGQNNGITVAVHPLSGATELDDFNSAFGRLAVICTRATHGLLLLTRPGLSELLADAPARPGTPFGEPGNRTLPRQTHLRILDTFARGHMSA
ncbi:MAG: AAA family ATPase [Promicromonosporaceae bacterium]|nr:AAA family ATPase [Promicromonosporaceae bacterium]